MKDEIKEINIPENVLEALGNLESGALNYYKAPKTIEVYKNTILDYITNLKQELAFIKNDYKKVVNFNDDNILIIHKAIKIYENKNTCEYKKKRFMEDKSTSDLMYEALTGGDV